MGCRGGEADYQAIGQIYVGSSVVGCRYSIGTALIRLFMGMFMQYKCYLMRHDSTHQGLNHNVSHHHVCIEAYLDLAYE